MVTPKDTIGFIQRRYNEEGKASFKFIEAKVKITEINEDE